MDPDLALGVREYLAIVNGGGSLRRFAVAGVGDMEFSVFNWFPGDTIFLKNRDFRGLPVSENESLFIAGAEGNGLGPVRVLVREVVRRGHGLFRDLVGAGFHPEGNGPVRASGPVILISPVQGLDRQDRLWDRGLGVRVNFLEGEQRFLLVFKADLFFVAGIEADGLRRLVTDVVRLRHGLLGNFVGAGGHPQFQVPSCPVVTL